MTSGRLLLLGRVARIAINHSCIKLFNARRIVQSRLIESQNSFFLLIDEDLIYLFRVLLPSIWNSVRRNLDESQSSDNEPEVVERNKSHRALTAFCTLCEHATLWGAVAGNENGLGHCREHWRINKARVLSVCVRVFTSLKDWLLLPFEKTTRSRLTAAVGKRCSGFLETFAVAPPDALCSQLRGKSGRKEGGDLHCACAASGFFLRFLSAFFLPNGKRLV